LCLAVVVSFNAELTGVLPGVTDAGEKVHEDAAGKPEQLSETGEPKLGPAEATVTV
jgi:hypothetical protein